MATRTSVHGFCDDALGCDDATALADRIRRRELSQQEITAAAIARLERVNPALNALVTTQFDAAVRRAERGIATGFFAGVPSLIKDNIDLLGMPTGHGSSALTPHESSQNCPVAVQYCAQGFNLLGKTSLPAFGFTASTEMRGFSPTRNPWSLAHSSGGSSGGSAALVAAGAVPIAHGNDGGGSIRIPAACCGLVGLKSTRGRLVDSKSTRSLPVNIVSEGVLTRTVRDTANFFAEAERYYRNSKLAPVGQVTGPAQKRLRIGFVLDSLAGDPSCPQTRATVEHTARLLESMGHHVEPATIDIPARLIEDFLLYWAMLAFLVSKLGKQLFNADFNAAELDPLTRGLSGYFRQRFLKAPGMLYQLRNSWKRYAAVMQRFDLMLTPVLAHVTPELGYLGPELPFETHLQRLLNYTTFTPVNNASGSPAISLPLGRSDTGLPIGIQLSGHHGDERTLLELAFELEIAQPFRYLHQAGHSDEPAANM